ncbi:hypothetical protein B0T17DRAFT_612945 [Bombardia bombarda]|uniref:Uncharacterized protein n=1 Tax=Bombardia bombarda TaxID=252184 RepID=A0AA40CFC0_9PEZI|nr:hypothetical protein B0T17DRAFT_612945 [Bombardia bombarda]
MSKEPKEPREPKHRVEGLRQPQRKDSLSSVLSWAGLQAKPSPPRTPTSSSSTSPQSSQSSPAQDISKSRRHSHGPEAKTKARRTSTTSRRFSLSNPTGTEEDSSTKTKRAKTASTLVDSKSPSDGSSRTTRNGSADKINKLAQEAPDARKKASKQQLTAVTSRDKSSSQPERPISPKPKGILRISSPDGSRPPRHIASFPAPIPTPTPAPAPAPAPNPDLGQQPDSPEPPPLSPLQPDVPSTTPDTTPISPPTSPISRPLSPGATVRFAKATIHRVEVGPGRRFIPVKRKSKSTITYIAPLDPGTQKSAPKGMLGSPTKLRRHQENQAAMGRYWLRTEEEEAQWRADAERRAVEEAEKYRAEPSSPPPSSVLARSPIGVPVPGIQSLSFAERVSELEKLPSVENLPALDKLEIEEAESEDEEATETPGMGALLADEEDPEPTTTTAADEWPDEAPVEVIGLGIEEAVQPRSQFNPSQIKAAAYNIYRGDNQGEIAVRKRRWRRRRRRKRKVESNQGEPFTSIEEAEQKEFI